MLIEGSLSLDREGRVIRFSQSLEEMLGYGAGEVMGKEFSFLAPPGMKAAFRSILDGADAFSSRKTGLLCGDGAVSDFYLSVHPLRDQKGGLYSYLITLSGRQTGPPPFLTDEFTRIFRFSNDSVVVTDRDGSIIDANPAFLAIYGYEKHEVLGRNPRVLKSPHSTKERYEKMWRDILDPAIGYWRGEIINLAKDGREIPVLLSINAIRDSQGEIKNFLGIAFDMTREKELDKLRKMYIDHIVHDIRGPLTSIAMNSDMLLMNPDLPEKVKRKLGIIAFSANKIDRMTSDILDYSRAESGSLALKREPVRISEAVREAVQPFEAMGKKLFCGGAPYSDAAFNGMEIFADQGKLTRVIYNLLSNAFKHADASVGVTAEIAPEGLVFKVSNDGRGIPAGEAERIFDAFYQAEDGVKTGGAGLGLSIVKSFVEAHGGRVWVEAGGERGVAFGFIIPGGSPME